MARMSASRPGNATLRIGANHRSGVRVGEMIFVGAQVDIGQGGRVLHPGDLAAQTRTTMEFVRRVVEDLGATMDDIVKVNTFYKDVAGADPARLHTNLAIRSGCFSMPGPVSTGVPLQALGLEDIEIEIEAWAMSEQ